MESFPPKGISAKQHWLETLGLLCPKQSFPVLMDCIDLPWLQEAYRRIRKTEKTSLDEQTAAAYVIDLQTNLENLLARAKSGNYCPVLTPAIPVNDIAAFEDRVLQQAVAMLLEPLYEQDFLNCSYGWRPKRSAQQALTVMWRQLVNMGGGWVIELSIEALQNNLDHNQLQTWFQQRVCDKQLCYLINQWLQAGLLNQKNDLISAILLNLYLHEALDSWFEQNVKKRLQGRSFLVRYGNQAILGFSDEAEARRVMLVLPKHFAKYHLPLFPEQTRLVCFSLAKLFTSSASDGVTDNVINYPLIKQCCELQPSVDTGIHHRLASGD